MSLSLSPKLCSKEKRGRGREGLPHLFKWEAEMWTNQLPSLNPPPFFLNSKSIYVFSICCCFRLAAWKPAFGISALNCCCLCILWRFHCWNLGFLKLAAPRHVHCCKSSWSLSLYIMAYSGNCLYSSLLC